MKLHLTLHWSRHPPASAALPLPGTAHRGRSASAFQTIYRRRLVENGSVVVWWLTHGYWITSHGRILAYVSQGRKRIRSQEVRHLPAAISAASSHNLL